MSWCSPVAHGSHCCHGYHNHWSPCCGPAAERKAVKGTIKCLLRVKVKCVCMCVCTYLKQQPVDLFADFLDVWIHDLPSMESRCCKNIFIHRTPETHRHTAVTYCPQIKTHCQIQMTGKKILNYTTVLWKYSRADFVSADNKGDFAAPGINKTGPAGVNGDILSVSCTETYRRMIEWLTSVLQNCWQQKVKCVSETAEGIRI